MWMFLWIVFLLAIIAAFVWSYHIIFEQKRSWAAFAKRYNLNYTPRGFFQAPEVSGHFKGRNLNIYTQERYSPETNTKTVTSIVEVFLTRSPEIYAAVCSPGLVDVMGALDLPEPFMVNSSEWPQQFLSRTFEGEPAAQWFLAEDNRIQAIKQLSGLPFETTFVANDVNSFVAVRTSHPLTDPKRINQIMGKLYAIASLLDTQAQIANPNASSESEPPSNVAPSE